jgi:hypothetical protein
LSLTHKKRRKDLLERPSAEIFFVIGREFGNRGKKEEDDESVAGAGPCSSTCIHTYREKKRERKLVILTLLNFHTSDDARMFM